MYIYGYFFAVHKRKSIALLLDVKPNFEPWALQREIYAQSATASLHRRSASLGPIVCWVLDCLDT